MQKTGSKRDEPNSQDRATGGCRVIRKEFFICDTCGTRTRLNSAERHWCELCTLGSPLEMRPTRDRRIFNKIVPLVLPGPARTRHPDLKVLFGCQSTHAA